MRAVFLLPFAFVSVVACGKGDATTQDDPPKASEVADEGKITSDLTNRVLKFCDGGQSGKLAQIDSLQILDRRTASAPGTDMLVVSFAFTTDEARRGHVRQLVLQYQRYDQGWLLELVGDRNVFSGFSGQQMRSDMCA